MKPAALSELTRTVVSAHRRKYFRIREPVFLPNPHTYTNRISSQREELGSLAPPLRPNCAPRVPHRRSMGRAQNLTGPSGADRNPTIHGGSDENDAWKGFPPAHDRTLRFDWSSHWPAGDAVVCARRGTANGSDQSRHDGHGLPAWIAKGMKSDPDLAALRDDARFKALLAGLEKQQTLIAKK